MTTEQETDWVAKIGQPAYSSIADMVAALECDYDRLEELRDERDNNTLTRDDGTEELDPDGWTDQFPDDAEELKTLEEEAGDCKDREEAETRISEDALDVTVRGERNRDGEWEADEFTILLSTGGPAVRIKGELDGNGEPDRAWLEVQDWFKPWTQYFPADQDVLLTYCRQFLFSE